MNALCTAALWVGLSIGVDCLPSLARLTVYDTALCAPGEACLQGNGDGYFGTMIPISAEWYHRMAACPPPLTGRTISVLDMELYCGDSFGTLDGRPVAVVDYDETAGWFMRIDVFYPVHDHGLPPWNYWLVGWN